ncbi:hypothetical protein [Rhodospirillum centenum]|uniref:Uncharacterized protein n=1 Tax=Rhodospirillum centenum (strain ATCC 51521 / SW) TaxID=414684 RepID=B6IVB0_RHOCS|nr:hypothetical protein [Rhodospirillum centenum]ACJ00234.1 hypothetical protein RC1_2864 [Rhodospirillum centenum SW]
MRSVIGIAIAVMLTAWAGGADASVPRRQEALDAAVAAGRLHLDGVVARIGERRIQDKGGLDLEGLALGLSGTEVPAAALAPVPEGSGSLARRLGAFVSGGVHWIGGRLLSDGLTAGVDLELDGRGMAGITASYVEAPEADGLTARTLAVYLSRTETSGTGLHAIAGIGHAAAPGGSEGHTAAPGGREGDAAAPGNDGGDARAAGVLFGELGGVGRFEPAPGLTLTPELRLGVQAGRSGTAGPGGSGAVAVETLARLAADYGHDLGRIGWLRLGADVSWWLPLGDGGRRRRDREARLRLGGRTTKSVLMLTASLERPEGTLFTLDHVTEDRHRGPDGHSLRAGMTVRF